MLTDLVQPSEQEQISCFNRIDLCWRSPESGGVWYKSRHSKKAICPLSEGWWDCDGRYGRDVAMLTDLTRSLTLCHTLSLSLSHIQTLSLTHTLSHTDSLSHTHTLSHT